MKKLIYCIACACGSIIVMHAQTVSTISELEPDDAITFDSQGAVYAASFEEGAIYKFTPQGVASTFITGLNNANGIEFDSNDALYVNDWDANELLRYFIDGTLDTSISISGNPSGMLKAIDNDDMIYTRYGANTINRITPEGIITQISDASELDGPVGLAYDENGNLYVGNYNDRKIYRVGTNGVLSFVATVGGSSNLGFITFGHGRLWGTVLGEHKIYTINHNAVNDVTLFAGSTAGNQDGDISQATFSQPNGIRFNASETTLYVTDFGTKNLRIIDDVILSIPSETVALSTVVLHPNPSSEYLHIKGLNHTAMYTITFTSMEGKILKEVMLKGGRDKGAKTISVSDLAAATYLVTITTDVGSITKQWIKE
ncbi:T9SS type A sorting domain-containing protein [Rasiella rasia]|uniref:T9SS type A sorting domain-containing protein n=1 Tax=Rasiella rasia TaxID=2744027 RepID=A0A6G6GM71_9FLAO|nr:T9SS type A sorting domain-containing protein [Rasiella rasia]QIE59652.1 T9SS type A sorting domain-containing protein [Rasiella rasia]